MKERTFKLPVYWGTLFEKLEDREVGIIIRAIFSYLSQDLIKQVKYVRRLDELSDEGVRVHDICLEDVRYQLDHPRSYRKPEDTRSIRNSSGYAEWRKSVYERDHYTCQHCGASGVTINAHHIKSFARYPSLRTDIDNGITLCTRCHKLVHKGGFRNA